MVENDDGFVALKHYNSNPATVKLPDGAIYSFVPKTNVSMAWVKQEHVAILCKIKARICCGKKKQKFVYANQLDVCLWETGKRC